MGLGYGSVVSPSKGDDMTFEEVQKLVMSHVCVRQWNKTKSSRGLAISLSLEANELLRVFSVERYAYWYQRRHGKRAG